MGWRGASIEGNNSVITKYHMNNCNSKGMLRVTSTCTAHSPRNRMLFDNRPMPINVPSTVANTIPTKATRKVLDKPTR